MIIVTGATGQLGSAIVKNLLQHLPASKIGISVRDPAKAADLAALGVRVRQGDFAMPESLSHAFEGAEQVLLVSSNAAAHGGDPVSQHAAAIAAVQAAGAQRIVYTSHMAAAPDSAFPPMHTHAVTEQMLAGSGLAWTALRNGFYAASARFQLGDVAASGALNLPADGPVSWTTHDDLAQAAALILTQPGRFDGPTPPLTAGAALDMAGLAAILSDILGRPIKRTIITDEDFAQTLAGSGRPAAVIEIALGMFRAARAGEFSATDPTLANLLGRPMQDMAGLLRQSFGPVMA